MIFHAAADIRCYELWYDMFYDSVREHCPSAKRSFHFVGTETVQPRDIDIFTQDNVAFDQIRSQYGAPDEKSARGYYCISRFLSIPCVGDDVLLCDIDLKLIKALNMDWINHAMKDHQAVNFCRLKFDGRPGGMMALLLRQDICESVRDFARRTVKEQPLWWGLDSTVREYIYNYYSVKNEIALYNVGHQQNLSAADCVFAYHKKTGGNRHANKEAELKSFKTA